MTEIAAISLPDSERRAILDLFGSADAFTTWQRETLAAEIERRASARGAQTAQAVIQQAVAETREAMPTLFATG